MNYDTDMGRGTRFCCFWRQWGNGEESGKSLAGLAETRYRSTARCGCSGVLVPRHLGGGSHGNTPSGCQVCVVLRGKQHCPTRPQPLRIPNIPDQPPIRTLLQPENSEAVFLPQTKRANPLVFFASLSSCAPGGICHVSLPLLKSSMFPLTGP